jgi:hypothetical protein
MQGVETLHREAMELLGQAVLARQHGDAEVVMGLSRAAFAKERAAADLVANQFDLEPIRSVLHRSQISIRGSIEPQLLLDRYSNPWLTDKTWFTKL